MKKGVIIDWVSLLMPEVEKIIPTATHDWDNDGQLVIYTGLYNNGHEDQLTNVFPSDTYDGADDS